MDGCIQQDSARVGLRITAIQCINEKEKGAENTCICRWKNFMYLEERIKMQHYLKDGQLFKIRCIYT